MIRPVRISPEAGRDVSDAALGYDTAREGLGDKFLQCFHDTLERIEFMPESFGVVWRNVRAVKIRRFRQVVYYTVLSTRIEIIAVVHGSRNNGVWQSRA